MTRVKLLALNLQFVFLIAASLNKTASTAVRLLAEYLKKRPIFPGLGDWGTA